MIKDYVMNENGEKEIKFRHLCDSQFWTYRSLSKVREMFPKKIDDAIFLNNTLMFEASEDYDICDIAIKSVIKDNYNEKTVRFVYLVKKDIYNLPSEERERIEFANNKENYKTLKEKRNEKLETMDYYGKIINKTTKIVSDATEDVAKICNVAQNVIDHKPNVKGDKPKIEKEKKVEKQKNENDQKVEKQKIENDQKVEKQKIEKEKKVEKQKIENGQKDEKQKIDNGQNVEKVTLTEILNEEKEHKI